MSKKQPKFMDRRTANKAIGAGVLSVLGLGAYSTAGSIYASRRPEAEPAPEPEVANYEEIPQDSFADVYETLSEDTDVDHEELMDERRFERRTDGDLGTGEIASMDYRVNLNEDYRGADPRVRFTLEYEDATDTQSWRDIDDDLMRAVDEEFKNLYGEEQFNERYRV